MSEEKFVPQNPDSEGWDIRDFIGRGHHYLTWIKRITPEEQVLQKERLQKWGDKKNVPRYDENGNRIVIQGFRLGLDWTERNKRVPGRAVGVKDSQPREQRVEFSKAMQRKFLHSLAETGSVRASAAEIGVSYGTVYLQARRNERFKALMEIAREKQNAAVRRKIQDRILHGEVITERNEKGDIIKTTHRDVNASLAIRWLEATQPDEFSKKNETTHLHIGADEAGNNKHLANLAQRLGINLDKPEEKDITEIDGEYTEKD